MLTKRPSWRLADLIDYEFFLDGDERQTADQHDRDRSIYLEKIAPALPEFPQGEEVPTVKQRREILRRWTDARRAAVRAESPGAETIFPGEAFSQVRGGLAFALAILALALGWIAATSALLYSAGAEPINAFVFFVEFALLQVVILVGACLVLCARAWFPGWQIPSLARLGMRSAAALAGSVWKRNRVRIAGTKRQNAEALFGVLRARHALYRGVLIWSLVGLTQIFAISFNAGVLGAMTARHLFHDLDFGWESTWLDASEVSGATEAIATPWSWLVRPGYPDAGQVAGSQNRKRGSGRLDAASLKSWSQFLFGVVIVYGLLPRLLLLGLAARAQRSGLRRLNFRDGRSASTLSRLLTPVLQTHGANDAAVGSPAAHDGVLTALPSSAFHAGQPAIILNLTGCTFDQRAATLAIGQPENPQVALFQPNAADREEETQTYASLARQIAETPQANLFTLLPAWTPPMLASKLSLDHLRASVGPEALIRFVLIGKPTAEGTFKPVRATDRELWLKALQMRGDPFLSVPAAAGN